MNRKRKKYVEKYSILIALIIIPLIPPEGLIVLMPHMYVLLYKMGKYISSILILILFFEALIHKRIKIFYTYGIIFLIFIWDLIITFIKGGDIKGCVGAFYSVLFLGILIISNTKKLKTILNILFKYLMILTLLNGVCMCFFPDGMYTSMGVEGYTANWLLGYKSSFQYYLLPLLCITYLKLVNSEEFVLCILSIILVHGETIASQNKMLLIGIAIVDMAILNLYVLHWKRINAYITSIVALLTNYILIFVPISNFQYIHYFITKVLKKDLTKGRIYLWKITISWIKKSWVTGYGWVDSNIRYGMYRIVAHAHNQLLEFIFQGGIIQLTLYLILIFYVAYLLNKNYDFRSVTILIFSLFSLYIMTTVEIFTRGIGAGIWLLFILPESMQYIYVENDS